MSQISLSHLTFNYENSYENIFENVSFTIDTNWKLGFIGRNGRGKTTFLKLLMGHYDYSGVIAATVNFEYFPFEIADPCRLTGDIVNTILDDVKPWELHKEMSLRIFYGNMILQLKVFFFLFMQGNYQFVGINGFV